MELKRKGRVTIRAANLFGVPQVVEVEYPVPSRFTLRVREIMESLPRGFEDVAVSPADFDYDLREVMKVKNPVHVEWYHRLRRVWIREFRASRPKLDREDK